MMRSLWTGASGMQAQQLAVDTIANNMANVNTTGFNRERIEFQSLLYQTIQSAGHNPAVVGNRPAALQVGHGVRAVATTRTFEMGNLETTGRNLDVSIQGRGFFVVDRGSDHGIAYTRDGAFNLSPIGGGQLALVNSEGLFILDTAGNPIVFADNLDLDTLAITQEGNFSVRGDEGQTIDLGMQLALIQFSNRQGLEKLGGNLFVETPASGAPMQESVAGEVGQRSILRQGTLERSNVHIAQEMVDLIVSQRAFEMNSRVIQTSDEMLQQANQLRR